MGDNLRHEFNFPHWPGASKPAINNVTQPRIDFARSKIRPTHGFAKRFPCEGVDAASEFECNILQILLPFVVAKGFARAFAEAISSIFPKQLVDRNFVSVNQPVS